MKSAYAAALEVKGLEIPGIDFVEKELLNMDDLTPLSSSYNTAVVDDDGGRPMKDDTEITDSATRMREDKNE